jgi:hypothetical protein
LLRSGWLGTRALARLRLLFLPYADEIECADALDFFEVSFGRQDEKVH